MMEMRKLYVHTGKTEKGPYAYVGAYEKHELTKMCICGADWHLWVECVEVGFYVVLARM